MQRTHHLAKLSTKSWVWIALASLLVGWIMEGITSPLWVHFQIHAKALEYLGSGIFWLGYCALWILLPIAAFRPEARFYLHGDCRLRLRRFGFVACVITIVHLLLFIDITIKFRGLGGIRA